MVTSTIELRQAVFCQLYLVRHTGRCILAHRCHAPQSWYAYMGCTLLAFGFWEIYQLALLDTHERTRERSFSFPVVLWRCHLAGLQIAGLKFLQSPYVQPARLPV